MESAFVVFLREQAFTLDRIAQACSDEAAADKLRNVCTELLEKAAQYEELVALRKN